VPSDRAGAAAVAGMTTCSDTCSLLVERRGSVFLKFSPTSTTGSRAYRGGDPAPKQAKTSSHTSGE
jgi:hypothetical protein